MSENNMVKIHGSVHRLRKMSGFSFLILRTAHQLIQCILEPEKCEIMGPDGSPWKETLKEEMCIRMEAQKVEEPRSRTGWELHPVRIRILSVPAEAMPVVIHGKEIPASLETILDFRPLTLRNERERAVFRIQDALVRGFTEFLQKEDFVQIHTPKLVSQGALADSSPVRSGEYTFAAHQGELWVATGTERTSRVVYFRLEVRHPRPLEPLNTAVERRVWAEDDRGGTALSYTEYYALDVWEREDRAVVHCTVLDRGVFTDQYEVSLEIFDPEAERVDLRYTHMGADLTIPISLEVTGP